MEKFDFDSALKGLQSGQSFTGKDGILTPLIKQLTEAALKAELELHLEQTPACRVATNIDPLTPHICIEY